MFKFGRILADFSAMAMVGRWSVAGRVVKRRAQRRPCEGMSSPKG